MQVANAWKGRHDHNYAVSLAFLGEVAERKGDGVEARGRYRAALTAFANLKDVEAVIESLVSLARLEAGAGRIESAGRLFGAARSFADLPALTVDPIDVPDGIPEAALEEGAAMSFDEAVEYAVASGD